MSKHKQTEPKTAGAMAAAVTAAAQTKRYDEAFKKAAVENWIRTGRSGTRIAHELGVSYPSLKDWKRRYDGGLCPARRKATMHSPSRRTCWPGGRRPPGPIRHG